MNQFIMILTNIINRIIKSDWLVIISFFVLSVLLKLLYILGVPIWRVDIFCHIQSAKTMLDGGVLFRDFGNIHPAGIVFLHWSLMKLFGYTTIPVSLKAAALISQTGAVYFFYRIIKKGYSGFMGYICAVLFIAALTINWELWPANIMFFYLFPVMAGIFVIYNNAEQQKLFPYFIGGILFSISALLCTNTILYTLLVPVVSWYHCRSIKKFFIHSATGFAGFLIPMAFNFGYFYYHNALFDYYLWNVKFAAIYASYLPSYLRFINIFFGMAKTWQWIPLYIFSFYGLYILLKKKLYRDDFTSFFALTVFFISLLARLGMIRSPVRYSLYLLPGLIILLPIAFKYYNTIDRINLKRRVKVLSISFLLIVLCINNVIAYVSSRKYVDYKRKNLHEWVIKNTDPSDSIFVWFEGYELYFFTGRKMATSYWSTSECLDHLGIWEANKYKDTQFYWERFIEEFKRDKPKIVIDPRPVWYKSDKPRSLTGPQDDFLVINHKERKGDVKKYFDVFKEYFDQHYVPVTIIDEAKIWVRKD